MKTTGMKVVVCVFTFAGILSTFAVDTTPPVLHITTPDTTVDYATHSIDISGTSEHVSSSISWKNERTGATGSIAESSSWTITGIPLVPGENRIKVWGSGYYGTASDNVLITRNYSPTTRLVSPDSPADGPGTAWSNAFHTIQAAIDAASDNYTIIVSNGVYETGGAAFSAIETLTNRVCVTKPLTIESLNGPSKTFIVGKGNQSAIDLDETKKDYVSIASSEALSLTNNYTIEAWIYPRSFKRLAGIVSKYHHASANGYMLRLSPSTPFRGLTIDEVSTTNTTLLSSNQWYHIAAVNDNGTRHLYVNGVEEALSTNDTPLNIKSNSDPLIIGCDFKANGRYFDGMIDEVRIWKTVRTQNEIQHYMQKRISTVNTNLVGYWKMDENHGSVALDSSLSQNNGTLANEATWGSTNLVDFGRIRCARLITNSVLSGFTLKDGTTLPTGDQNLDCGAGGALLYYGGTLTNCVVENNFCYDRGGGINLYHGGTVINCTIENNAAAENGGGILDEEGIVTDSTITNNTAENGGGIYCSSTDEKIDGCTITENSAEFGGGIYKGSLTNCVMTHNSAKENGGGCYNSTLTDCEIAHNIALYGGGVYKSSLTRCIIRNNKARNGAYGGGSASSTLENCKIFNNDGANGGGGTFYCSLTHCIVRNNHGDQHGGGAFRGTLKNCIVVNNSSTFSGPNIYNASVTNSCSPDLTDGVDGNITNAPLFVDADANNFHLQTNSPCIDAGLNGLLASDFEGTPRPLDSDNNGTAIADMGCYELMNNAADSDGDSASDGDEIIADTNPADSNSWFHITSATADEQFSTVEFDSSSKRRYYLVGSTNLLENSWTEITGTSKIGVDGLDHITITNDLPLLFYKLEVERN